MSLDSRRNVGTIIVALLVCLVFQILLKKWNFMTLPWWVVNSRGLEVSFLPMYLELRFLFCSAWDESFGFIKQSLLPKVFSNHSPLLLQCNQWNNNAKSSFKFKHMWLETEGFVDRIKDWWNSFTAQGSPDFIFASKLKSLKFKLKEWNSNSFGYLGARKLYP